MNRKTYLRRLRTALKGVPKAEVENLVSYYFELIDDGVERGKTEAEICAELDPPELAAEHYRQENGFAPAETDAATERGAEERRGERRAERRTDGDERRRVPLWLVVLGFPVWFPLLIVVCALAFALVVVLFAFLVTLSAVSLGFIVGGLYFIAMSFGLFGGHAALAFTQIGWGFALIGLGILLSLLIPLLGKAVVAVVRRIAHRQKSDESKRSAKGAVVTFACGAAVLIAGIAVGTCGFAGLGFDYRNLAVREDLTERTEILAIEAENLTLVTDHLALTVETTDQEARIVFWESAEFPKSFSYENGAITLTSPDQSGSTYLKSAWKRGVLYSALAGAGNEATLYLPQDYAGSLTVDTENGSVAVGALTLGDVSVTTNNGAVTVTDCSFRSLNVDTKNGAVVFNRISLEGDLNAETHNGLLKATQITAKNVSVISKNGAVNLEDVASEVLKARTNNGAIKTTRVDAVEIELICSNGAITGSISGSVADYAVTASTVNGSCNLSDTATGERTLLVRTENGMISLTFTD